MKQDKNLLRYIMTAVKGMCMGAADVIPGVSGGTIAFMTGIYEELLSSIKSIDASALKLLLKGKVSAFWKHINGNFLLSVMAGILVSVFSLARLMQYLLDTHPIPTWSFFLGLIISSSIYIIRDIIKGSKAHFANIFFIIIGIVAGIAVCMLSPTQTPDAYWFIFLSGAIAICAMILPGISGSFILVILGKYDFIMKSISEMNIPVLIVFALGAAVGIIAFSHFLTWLLKKCHYGTLSVLAGFIIGSLVKVWPWSVELPAEGIRPLFEGATFTPVLPSAFTAATGSSACLTEAIIFAAAGFILVFAIEYAGIVMKRKSETV